MHKKLNSFYLLAIFAFLCSLEISQALNEKIHQYSFKNRSRSINIEEALKAKERLERQLKWLQPDSFVLSSSLRTPKGRTSLDSNDGGRFFKVINKGHSMSSVEMLSNVLKQALEELDDLLKQFENAFETYVQNEIEIAALTPDPATEFSNALSTILQNSITNLNASTLSLLQALTNFLGIDLVGLLGPTLNSILGPVNLGGLPVIGR
ncbi:UNVERIFIED_CONTAM: hypothetical protein RMT77_019667 [Armadillidium vulgare]